MNPSMGMDLMGRLGNFPLSVEKPLLPVFEAISNSMHAIEDSKRTDGRIVVHIFRRNDQKPLTNEQIPVEPITGFMIEDNGIGFNDENLSSFCTADSRRKQAKGGKGVGRLSWLKVFDKAEVASVFDEYGVKMRRDFSLTLHGIEDHELCEAGETDTGTTITLLGLHEDFQKHCWKQYDTIARKIIEHFLEYFVLKNCPEIRLNDKYEQRNESLNNLFANEINIQSEAETITVGESEFEIQHFRIMTKARDPEHQLHFCARQRSVETRDLTKLLANLRGPLQDPNSSQFVYAGYVSGPILDDNVNQERTRINFLHENTLLQENGEPTYDKLIRTLANSAEAFLEPFLAPIKEEKFNRIREYVRGRPRFRPILKLRPEWLHSIHVDASDDELDLELYRLMHRLEIDVRREGVQLRNEEQSQIAPSVDDHKKKFDKFLTESNQVGFSKLADYVIHRRAVIEFLLACLKRKDDGRYHLEDVVHDVIFPMRTTSSDIPDPDQSNLWMLDERLAYHYYLASDMEFRNMSELKVLPEHERRRLDVLVLQPYDWPHAFVGENVLPFDSVTIVEFKRPMRDDYSAGEEDRDPVKQVWGYTNKIRSGTAKDKSGQFIQIREGTQFYAYIICNLTPKMQALAEFYSFTKMPDGMGYFSWQSLYKVYTEILDYNKLIHDARKRNQVFFDKFNLPPFA